MAFTVEHTQIGEAPYWYHLETVKDLRSATTHAQTYATDHGGYICVKDERVQTVFGTDPVELDRAILAGINKHFPRETARRRGCCVQ